MYDQVVAPHDPLIALHETGYLFVICRIDGLSQKRLQCIPGNADTRPHDNQGHAQSDEAVNVPAREAEKQKGEHRGCVVMTSPMASAAVASRTLESILFPSFLLKILIHSLTQMDSRRISTETMPNSMAGVL